jgi:hypothetical protein
MSMRHIGPIRDRFRHIVLDDISRKLRLAKDAKKVHLTNAHLNMAQSVRAMNFSDESKGDLRFLIPPEEEESISKVKWTKKL